MDITNADHVVFCEGQFSINGTIDIKDNTFSNNFTTDHIFIQRIPGTYNSQKVENNTFFATSAIQRYFIHVDAFSGGSSDFKIINNTIINTANAVASLNGYPGHGIWVEGNASRYSVWQNTLDYSAPTGSSVANNYATQGIAFVNVNGFENEIKSNTITASLNTSSTIDGSGAIKCAIHAENSANLNICGNTVNGTYRGFHFANALGFCNWATNTMGSHFHGMLCRGSGSSVGTTSMGDQFHHQNIWSGSYVTRGAQYDGTTAPPFRIIADGTQNPAFLPPSFLSSNFVENIAQVEPSTSNCVAGTFSAAALTSQEKSIIEGTYEAENEADAWETEYALMRKLIEYPELRNLGSGAAAYFFDHQSKTPYFYALAEHKYYAAYKSISPALVESQETLMEAVQNQLQAILALYEVELSANQEDLSEELKQMLLEYGETQQALSELNEQIEEELRNNLEAVRPFVDNISEESSLDAAHKAYLSHRLDIALGLEGDMEKIRQIVNSCPLDVGNLISKAASYLPTEEAYIYKDEDFEPNCSDRAAKSDKTEIRTNAIQTWPNPSSDFVYLEFPTSSGRVQIFDASGTLIRTQTLETSNRLRLNVANYAPGLYQVHYVQDGMRPIVSKFSVVR